jgi:hypothetical protein
MLIGTTYMVTYVKIQPAGGGHFECMHMRVTNDRLNLCPSLKSFIWSCTTFIPNGILVIKSDLSGYIQVLESPLIRQSLQNLGTRTHTATVCMHHAYYGPRALSVLPILLQTNVMLQVTRAASIGDTTYG